LAGFGLTMLLFALSLSYLWTSGFSDNFLIGGLLPYKDAKNYYLGANLLLHGLPIRVAGQALGRPLFPGFLSSLLLLTGQNLKITLAVLVQLAGIGPVSLRAPGPSVHGRTGRDALHHLYVFLFPAICRICDERIAGLYRRLFRFRASLACSRKAKVVRFAAWPGGSDGSCQRPRRGLFCFPPAGLVGGPGISGAKRFSLLMVIATLTILVAGYFVVNTIYPRLLGVPEGSSFGNFAYTVYGQVRGGIGWHSAIDELGTRNPSRVYQAAWDVFLANPSGFLKGIIKAYADFFLPGAGSVFRFGEDVPGVILWAFTILIFLRGLYLSIFKLRSDISTLLLAGFVGIFLSIPFLPPIDGGNRFYASTMPFFFVLLAMGAARFAQDERPVTAKNEMLFLRFVSVSLLTLTVLLPPVTLRASALPTVNFPACSPEQRPFVIRIKQGSYINLFKDENASCGLAPEICYDDFLKHNTEMRIDDFYQELDSLAVSSQNGIRVIPTLNLIDGYFQYFVITDPQVFDSPAQKLLSGCATRILTENQRIFLIGSISGSDE
jgi:hypothetical protein